MHREIFVREDFLNKKPKSILKKRLFIKLNSIIYTNGSEKLIEEEIHLFIPKPYHLVPSIGANKKKLAIAEEIMIDIGPEYNNIPAVCEFLVVKNGAAKQNSQVLVRDASIQINFEKSIKYTDFYSIQRIHTIEKKANNSIDKTFQTDKIKEIKIEIAKRPSENKSIGTDDIIDSLPNLKKYKVRELMSESSLDNNKVIISNVKEIKSCTKYRFIDTIVRKIEDKCPMTETKRVSLLTPFCDIDSIDNKYEEYLVKDCHCDTDDLKCYFNFEDYSFGDLLSGKINIDVKKIDDEIPFKLIDIKIVEQKKPEANLETKKIESKKYAPQIEIKIPPAKRISRNKGSSFSDLISSIDKKIETINKLTHDNRIEFDTIKERREQISEMSQSNFNSFSIISNRNKVLEDHIEKYYSTSTMRYPLIKKALEKNKQLKPVPVYDSLNYAVLDCSHNHEPIVDYLNSFKICSVCSHRRDFLLKKQSPRSQFNNNSSLSNFDNLIKNTSSFVTCTDKYKNYTNEYFVDNSVIIDDDTSSLNSSRYDRVKIERCVK